MSKSPLKILVLCTGNSCRSQMAEGFFRTLGDNKVTVRSAGVEAHGLNPLAVKTMSEIGVDLSGHRSQTLDNYLHDQFDYVITVCDNAAERCPVFPGEVNRLHWPFEDPAKATGTESERLLVFARIRDQIKDKVVSFLAELA